MSGKTKYYAFVISCKMDSFSPVYYSPRRLLLLGELGVEGNPEQIVRNHCRYTLDQKPWEYSSVYTLKRDIWSRYKGCCSILHYDFKRGWVVYEQDESRAKPFEDWLVIEKVMTGHNSNI